VSADAQLAGNMFVLWWAALGGLSILSGVMTLLYALGTLRIWLYDTYVVVVLLALFVALWGLQFYLMYLYTGSKRSFTPLGVFYLVFFAFTLGLVQLGGTTESIVDNGWSIQAEPGLDLPPVLGLAFSVALIGPQLVAAIAYGRLYFKTDEPMQRYRIAMVTGAIIVWFGSALLAAALQVNTSVGWQAASRIISIMAALAVLAAYKPPKWIEKHFDASSK
jgi:hypothetical protein